MFAPLIAFSGEFGALDPPLDRAGDRADDAVTVGSGSVYAAVLVVGSVVVLSTVFGAAFQVLWGIITNCNLTLLRTSSGCVAQRAAQHHQSDLLGSARADPPRMLTCSPRNGVPWERDLASRYSQTAVRGHPPDKTRRRQSRLVAGVSRRVG